MVAQATEVYDRLKVEEKAEEPRAGDPWQLVTVASLVQAEGAATATSARWPRSIYNRLEAGNTETNGMLEFDSTYNYIKNQSKIDLTLPEHRTTTTRTTRTSTRVCRPGRSATPARTRSRAP